jgi:F0F1-type ATP synthase assembly protein I
MDGTRLEEHGTNISDVTDLLQSPASDAFTFNEREQTILKLWDQEEEVRLELYLLKAQNSSMASYVPKIKYCIAKFFMLGHIDEDISNIADGELQEHLKTAERELLEARSKYMLRNQIIQNVLIADPVLKAVHSGSNTTELERRLLPLINERDVISMTATTLSSKLQTLNAKLATLERENIAANEQNKELARVMLELANELKAEKVEEVQDARARAQLERLDDETKKARMEWRLMKSLVAGIVAGSGIDWARDPKLLGLVMDEEDELG